jgi:hypothetical protein
MKYLIGICLLACLTASVYGQVKFLSGDLGQLKNIKTISIKMVYDSIKVDGKLEEVFIADKKKELNEKEIGRGDEWERKWREDSKNTFHSKIQ